jgi:hypothetical protein
VDREGKTVLDIAAGYIRLSRSQVLSLENIKMLFEYGAIMTIPVVASMVSERDEGLLSSSLRATRDALHHGVVYAKNPIMASLTISAAFRLRSQTAFTIRDDLMKVSKRFSEIAVQLMRADALTDEQLAIEMLTMPEHNYEIDTAFAAGAVKVALESRDGDFIAQPVVQRLVGKIWHGGDWALIEFKRFFSSSASTFTFYDYVKGQHGRADVSTLVPLMQEVAHPAKMRRVPVVQFWYEVVFSLVFIFLTIDKIIEGADMDGHSDTGLLQVFIVGNILFEVGQIIDEGLIDYLSDIWNQMDVAIYIIFVVWLYLHYFYSHSHEHQITAQQVFALNGFLMSFRFLNVVRQNKVLGPLVLMVLQVSRFY